MNQHSGKVLGTELKRLGPLFDRDRMRRRNGDHKIDRISVSKSGANHPGLAMEKISEICKEYATNARN
jgi:hypothetical protein